MNINSTESAAIIEVTGQHIDDQTNNDVMGFWAKNNKIQFFPRSLHKIFKNLELILIMKSQLKEIHQKDLKYFPKLEFLCLDFNEIEVIEDNLFAFNPNLIFISISFNKIHQIGPDSFSHLKKLNYLWMISNPCINMYAENNLKLIKKALKSSKQVCSKSNEIWIILVVFVIFIIFILFFGTLFL